jgi:hypothetical protein
MLYVFIYFTVFLTLHDYCSLLKIIQINYFHGVFIQKVTNLMLTLRCDEER